MTRDELEKAWPILEAFKAGKQIQFNDGKWSDISDISMSHLVAYPERYRVNPEPREFWILEDGTAFPYIWKSKERALEYRRTHDLLSKCPIYCVREVID